MANKQQATRLNGVKRRLAKRVIYSLASTPEIGPLVLVYLDNKGRIRTAGNILNAFSTIRTYTYTFIYL